MDDVVIRLTGDEALVLLELLHRWEDEDSVGAPQDQAEQVAPWNLAVALERSVAGTFDPGHTDLVRAARRRLGPDA